MPPLFGVYAGNEPAAVKAFEAWMGRRVDFITVYTGEASWDDFDSGPVYEYTRMGDLGRLLNWSIPLIPAQATLLEAGRGSYNDHYARAAKTIAQRCIEPVIYVRTGWEQNGDWMKWAAKGREAQFIASYQQFASCFRAVSDRFKLVWCPNIGQNDPATSYPGDDFVDVIGLDVYHQRQWDPPGPVAAWTYMVTRRYGLQWHLEFASAHGKPIAYPEWGVRCDGFEFYIKQFARWFEASNVVYQSYWDSNAAYPGKLHDGHYPSTGAAFRAAFGRIV